MRLARSFLAMFAGLSAFYGLLAAAAYCAFTASIAHGDVPAQTNVPCLPTFQYPLKAAYGALPAGVSTRATHYLAHTCETPAGYRTITWIGKPDIDLAIGLLQRTLSLADVQARCAAQCWATLTDSEAAFTHAKGVEVAPVAKVSPNGTDTTRPFVAADANGAPGAKLGDVPVGQVCDEETRLVGTNYYAVTVGGVTGYAQCDVTFHTFVQALGTTAYKMRQAGDTYTFVPIGKVPAGTVCDIDHVIGEYAVVPRALVTPFTKFDTLPLITFAKCG